MMKLLFHFLGEYHPCRHHRHNADTGKWMEDLDAAKNYGGTMNLYAYDGVIRIVEVKG